MRTVSYKIDEIEKEGYFHCWAGTMQDAYALIEDRITGKMIRLSYDEFRFEEPPTKKFLNQ